MIKYRLKLFFFLVFVLSRFVISAQVGTVGNLIWRDENENGLMDEPPSYGINGVSVELWNVGPNGIFGGGDDFLQATATSNFNGGNPGFYRFTLFASGTFYVKFPVVAGFGNLTLQNATPGTDLNSDPDNTGTTPVFSIDILSVGVNKNNSTIDAGYKPSHYLPPDGPRAQDYPKDQVIATPMYVNGDPLAGGTAGTQAGFVWFSASNIGESTPPSNTLSASQVGSVWGVSYNKKNNALFTSAFYKRHTGFGPGGIGAIYKIDLNAGSPTATLFTDIRTMGVNVGTSGRVPTAPPVNDVNELPASAASPSWDADAYDAVGKRSLGGLDVSEDGNTMYVMNLFDRELVELDITSGSPVFVRTYKVPNPGCTGNNFRPWAVKCYGGKVYIGVVCSAETSQNQTDLYATVMVLENSNFSIVTSFPLDYNRGNAGGIAPLMSNNARWMPWSSTFITNAMNNAVIYPQPILSDIEFDMDGSMTVALMDRNGHQSGYDNYNTTFNDVTTYRGVTAGDVIRLGIINNEYLVENNGSASGVAAQYPDCITPGAYISGQGNLEGPGGGEYYWGDRNIFDPCNPNATHTFDEITSGGLTFRPGSDEMMMGAFNPTSTDNSAGIIWLSNSTGRRTHLDFSNRPSSEFLSAFHGYRLYNSNTTTGYFGMANGIGDIETFSFPSATIGNWVWLDLNFNGVQDTGEKGVSGVKVLLLDNSNNFISATISDAYGNFYFSGLNAGNYKLEVVLPIDYAFSPELQGGNTDTDSDIITTGTNKGRTTSFAITANQQVSSKDIGIYYSPQSTSAIGNYVWFDINANGIQDLVEKGVVDVQVSLTNAAGDIVASTVTDDMGNYKFSGLAAGNYKVEVLLPPGYRFSTPNLSTEDKDSDIIYTGVTGATDIITLIQGEQNMRIDAGIYRANDTLCNIGNKAWVDINADGIQGIDEPGLADVLISLFDYEGNLIATSHTNGAGNYIFPNIRAGYYYLETTPPTGYSITAAANAGGNDRTDSDFDAISSTTDTLSLSGGDIRMDLDLGLTPNTILGLAKVGDRVWFDTNINGIQDIGELGIEGVVVSLLDNSNNIIQSTTTDKEGYYIFVNIAPGTYKVKFGNIPEGLGFTLTLQGTPATDSDIPADNGGLSLPFVVGGTSNYDIDCGLFTMLKSGGMGTLGDLVWDDINSNGIQDSDEPGIPNIVVTLYLADCSTVFASTRTDVKGRYIFNEVPEGDYCMGITLPVGFIHTSVGNGTPSTDSDFIPATSKTGVFSLTDGRTNVDLDAGLVYTNMNTSAIGDYVWLDANKNGINDVGELPLVGISVNLYDNSGNLFAASLTDENGFYYFPHLPAGTYKVGFANLPHGFSFTTQRAMGIAAGNNSDPNVEDGKSFNVVLSPTINKEIDAGFFSARAMLGNQVWFDENKNGLFDVAEAGISGVTVHLYNSVNQLVSSAITDAKGKYLFMNVLAGSYYLVYADLPEGAYFTTQNVSGLPSTNDSDVNPLTGRTNTFTISNGETFLDFDAGLIEYCSGVIEGYVWVDEVFNGQQDAGEKPAAGLLIRLFDNVTNVSVLNTVSRADGGYVFKGVPPGTYRIRATNRPLGLDYTFQNVGADATDSDISPSGDAGIVTVSCNVVTDGPDIGFQPPVTVNGLVFSDIDQDGMFNNSDTTLSKVYITLYDAGNLPMRTFYTYRDGNYSFENLLPNTTYSFEFMEIQGRNLTSQNAGNDALDSDVDPSTRRITFVTPFSPGQFSINNSAGYLPPSPFPIELLSFSASLVGEDGWLQWVTSTEVNSSRFVVERSLDRGFSFGQIGSVDAAGHSTVEKTYSFPDYNITGLSQDVVFYRLRMEDIDGTFKYSNIVQLRLTDKEIPVFAWAYPNPTSDLLNVDCQFYNVKWADIQISNNLGQIIYSNTLRGIQDGPYSVAIDTKSWASGIYHVNIYSDKPGVKFKIIKE